MSAEEAVAEECVFCGIRDRSIPATRVYEDELCLAFEDAHPKAPLHVLVCPKEHIATLSDADYSHQTLLGRLSIVAAKLAAERGEESFRTVMNTGAGAGQSVFHIHLHVLGGRTLNWPPG